MLKKLALDKTKDYEKHIVLEEISQMICGFLDGNRHNLEIGSEQGNIEKWDDIVIKKYDKSYIYVQVKRQSTDFSKDSVLRGNYIQGTRKDLPRDLSPFDKTLRSLGNKIKEDKNIQTNTFRIILPEGNVAIKEGLVVSDFRRFHEQIKSITRAEDLNELSKIDYNAEKIYTWLTSWCEFEDWEHILSIMKILDIRTAGFETDIKERSKKELARYFENSKIDNIVSLILSYIDENSTFAGTIRPRQLVYLLKDFLLSNIKKWTMFRTDDESWEVSGINDLINNDEIENPTNFIPEFWNETGYSHVLKINGECDKKCQVADSIMRLVVHSHATSNIACSNPESWKNNLEYKVAGTLGISEYDFQENRFLKLNDYVAETEKNTYKTLDEKEDFAQNMNIEMYKLTLNIVDQRIRKKINLMKRGELRTDVEKRWNLWKVKLSDFEQHSMFFSTMLHPAVEGESISGEMRVGPKTTNLLCESIYLMLIVSVCLCDNNNDCWEHINKELSMTSVALAFWSGPAGKNDIIAIDDESGIKKLLESETNQVIVIPQSTLTNTELLSEDIYGNKNEEHLLSHTNFPKLLLTKEREFMRVLNKGDKEKVKEYLLSKLEQHTIGVAESINQVVGRN